MSAAISAVSHAAFTIVHNEALWLPLWLKHYGQTFDAEDLFVLDHYSTDGSTSALEGVCNVVPIHRAAAFDHAWMKSVIEDFQAFLLRSYELVLFAEADEFIVADPRRHADLGAYMDALDRPSATCSGFNVVQQPARRGAASRGSGDVATMSAASVMAPSMTSARRWGGRPNRRRPACTIWSSAPAQSSRNGPPSQLRQCIHPSTVGASSSVILQAIGSAAMSDR